MKRPSLRTVLGALLLLLLIVGSALAYWWHAEIQYNARLLHAKILADRFYADSKSVAKNIAYGKNAHEKLDVYVPDAPGPHPVLIWVHGGGWTDGNKELYAPVAQKILPHNVVVVIPNYTLYDENARRVAPETPIAFQQAQEIAAAFVWARKNISQYGGDPTRIVLGGHSAGAHLTGLVALNPKYLVALAHTPEEICGWYGIAGPYDIDAQLQYEKTVKRRDAKLLFDVFGGPENFRVGSPLTYARANTPPILLIHGDADETVPLSQSQALQEKLRAAGANSALKIYPGAGHAGLLFDALAESEPRLVQDLMAFARHCR